MARLGKYEIIRPLSRGAVTELFLAHDQGTDGTKRPMALKRLLPQFSKDMEVVGSFLKEARVASGLEHPNIARVHDVGAAGKEYFVVMEYIHGLDLDEIQQSCQKQGFFISHAVVTQVMIQTCRGLHHAHTATNASGQALGIVHRNVHPQNILVDMSGQVKLVDFGFTQMGQSPQAGGSGSDAVSAYMSPEQCRGKAVTLQSDLFSAGIVLYELCCRRRLFRRQTPLATSRAILEDPIPPPSAVSDEVPDALEMIIMRALARNPQYRYASADEMTRDLMDAAQENGWSMEPGEVASLLNRLLIDDPLDPIPTPPPEPQLSDYIPASADEDTKLENPDGLDGLRTPGGTPKDEPPPAEEPARDLQDFWSATATPGPLPALSVDGDELPEAVDIPMIMSGDLDDHEDDEQTLVRSPVSSPVIIAARESLEDELVFEMDEGDDVDPLSVVPPPAGAVTWRQQSGASLEMYSNIPEASQPAIKVGRRLSGKGPRSSQGTGRETMQVKPVSAMPVQKTNTRAMILAALITIVVMGGGVALLFQSMSGSKLGTVKISSVPTGAKVVLDGKERFGVTPQTISDMVLGKPYLVLVVKDGFSSWRKKITLTADHTEATFEARLKMVKVVEGAATLVVETADPGARVFFDGELRGKTPLEIENVACNKLHSLVFKREGFLDLVQDVDKLKSGERRKVQVSMTPEKSDLEQGVLAPGRGKVRVPEDDTPVEIPRSAAPLRRLKDDSVGETLPRRVPKKLDK